MSNTIYILDAPTGIGKTQETFEWMKNNIDEHFIYISPLLSEVGGEKDGDDFLDGRIQEECPELSFHYPIPVYNHKKKKKTKGTHLLQLLEEGKNVSFTHSLFKEMKQEHLELVKKWGYILIQDEEMGSIQPYKSYKPEDIKSLKAKGLVDVDTSKLGQVVWQWPDMKEGTAYQELRDLCEMNQVYASKRDSSMIVLQLPISLVQAAKKTIIIGYMFRKSVMYRWLKLYGVETKDSSEIGLSVSYSHKQWKDNVRNLITVADTQSTKKWKESKGKRNRGYLSSSWWDRASGKDKKAVGNAILSVFKTTSNEEMMFTMKSSVLFKGDDRNRYKRNAVKRSKWPSAECFVGCSSRATNMYSNKSVLVHAYNRFPTVPVSAYLQDYGQPLDGDDFALSELVQWMWRSRIRKKEPITVYFLSKRMEDLFKNWLKEE